ncbi:MAG: hypothetical protein AB7T49_00930 [Oligoflexales bacterium]
MQRKAGEIQPGLRWGPFTLRIPFIHTKPAWPELFQGIFICAATSMALTPVMMNSFGLTFEEAVAAAAIHSALINFGPIFCGEPYAAGWITPTLPFIFAWVLSDQFTTPEMRFQAMTAISLDFAAVMFLLGITGMGKRFVNMVPRTLKSGIILGSAIAAFLKILDLKDAKNALATMPISATIAIVTCLLLAFSEPVAELKKRYRIVRIIADLGFLPGFVLAGLIGPLFGEIHFDIQWGFMVPPVGALWDKASPFSIGWPSVDMFISGLPLALIAYILSFGDILTGDAVIESVADKRPDEKIDINVTRTHYSVALRNLLMAIFAPFFPTQGVLWTGVHVIIVNKWAQGRDKMDSIYSGISSFYLFGLPVIYFTLPLITLVKPLLGIALILAVGLTAFACAYVGQAIVKTPIERGVSFMIGIVLALFDPWIGIVFGIAATLLLTHLNVKEGKGSGAAAH